MKPYERLRYAVIAQAAYDYNNALKFNNKAELYSLEQFFLSQEFYIFSDVDGKWLMNTLKDKFTSKKLEKKKCVYFTRSM